MTWGGEIPCHPAGRLLYVEVPKAGATSVKWALARSVGDEPPAGEDVHRWMGYVEAKDVSQLRDWCRWRWDSLCKFTVLRDPIARFESYFYGNLREPDINAYVLQRFSRAWSVDIHVAPQTQIVGDDLSIFDLIGHTEDLPGLAARIEAATTVHLEIGHLNPSTRTRQTLSDEASAKLREIYREDYAVLA